MRSHKQFCPRCGCRRTFNPLRLRPKPWQPNRLMWICCRCDSRKQEFLDENGKLVWEWCITGPGRVSSWRKPKRANKEGCR